MNGAATLAGRKTCSVSDANGPFIRKGQRSVLGSSLRGYPGFHWLSLKQQLNH